MATFLTRDKIYRILQRELPDSVYPDGPASGFYSTADMDSVADVAATGYANLERIYKNYFPQTADEYIGLWLDKMFVGISFDPNTPLQDQRDKVIAKVRKRPTIAMWEVLKIVAGFVPQGTYVQIFEFGKRKGGFWRLGRSRLGVDTILGFNHKYHEWGIPNDQICSFVSTRGWRLGKSRLGVDTNLSVFSFLQYIEPQLAAYGYQIRIFGLTLTGTPLQQMFRAVSEAEPARSVHFLIQNQNLSDFSLNTVVNDVDEFSGVNCITVDPSSNTGYTGRRA